MNFDINKVEKTLKSNLKTKISITKDVIIRFMMTGAIISMPYLSFSSTVVVQSGYIGTDSSAGNYTYKIALNPNTARDSFSDYAVMGNNSIAIGFNSQSKGTSSVGIGLRSQANGDESIAIGQDAKSPIKNSIAIGNEASVINENEKQQRDFSSIAIGASSKARFWSTVIGQSAYGHQTGVAIGLFSNSNKEQAVSVGHNSFANRQAVALGSDVFAYGESSIAIGNDDITAKYDDKLNEETIKSIYDIFLSNDPKINKSEELFKYRTYKENDIDKKENFEHLYGVGKRKYSPTFAKGVGSIAIGSRTVAAGDGSTSIGTLSFALANRSTTLGLRSFVSSKADGGTAIGEESRVFAPNSLAVGNKTEATSKGAMAYGYNAYAVGQGSIAIGANVAANAVFENTGTGLPKDSTNLINFYETLANNTSRKSFEENPIFLGNYKDLETFNESMTNFVNLFENDSVGLPLKQDSDVEITTDKDIKKKVATGGNAIAIGNNTYAVKQNSLALGYGTLADSENSFALGSYTYVKSGSNNSVALGVGSMIKGKNSFVIGTSSNTEADNTIILGSGSRLTENAQNSAAIGIGVRVGATNSFVAGNKSSSNASDTIVLGSSSNINSYGKSSIVLGNNSSVNSSENNKLFNTIIIGNNSKVDTTSLDKQGNGGNVAILGNNSTATITNSVVLGNNSTTNYMFVPGRNDSSSNGTVSGQTLDPYRPTNSSYGVKPDPEAGVVSVGGWKKPGSNDLGQRRIINVAAGALDSDAATVGQLRSLESSRKDDNLVYIVESNGKKVVKQVGDKYYHVDPDTGFALSQGNTKKEVTPEELKTLKVAPRGINVPNFSSLGTEVVMDNLSKGKIEDGSKQAVTGSQINDLITKIIGTTGKITSDRLGFDYPGFVNLKQTYGTTEAATGDTFRTATDKIIEVMNKGIKLNSDANIEKTMYLGDTISIVSDNWGQGENRYTKDNIATLTTTDSNNIFIGIKENPTFKTVKLSQAQSNPAELDLITRKYLDEKGLKFVTDKLDNKSNEYKTNTTTNTVTIVGGGSSGLVSINDTSGNKFETKNVRTYLNDSDKKIYITLADKPEFDSVTITKDQTATSNTPAEQELISKKYLDNQLKNVSGTLKYSDGINNKSIDLKTGTLLIKGTKGKVTTTANDNGEIVINLDSNIADKNYVDGKVNGLSTTLTYKGNTGENSINLNGGKLDVKGVTDEIKTEAKASGVIEIGLDKNVKDKISDLELITNNLKLAVKRPIKFVSDDKEQTVTEDISKKLGETISILGGKNQNPVSFTDNDTKFDSKNIRTYTHNDGNLYITMSESPVFKNVTLENTQTAPTTNELITKGYLDNQLKNVSGTLKYSDGKATTTAKSIDLKTGTLTIKGTDGKVTTTANESGEIVIGLDQSIVDKIYVDNKVASVSPTLSFKGDNATETGSVELKNNTLDIVGTTGEIETAASGNKLTIKLSETIKTTIDSKIDKNLTNLTGDGGNVIKSKAMEAIDVKSLSNALTVVEDKTVANKKTFNLSLDADKLKELTGVDKLDTIYAKVDASNITTDENKGKWRTALDVYSKSQTNTEIAKAKETVAGTTDEIEVTQTTQNGAGNKYTVSLSSTVKDKIDSISDKADKSDLTELSNKALSFGTNSKETSAKEISKKLGEKLEILGGSVSFTDTDNKKYEAKNIRTYTNTDGKLYITLADTPEFETVKILKNQTVVNNTPDAKELISKEYLESRLDGEVVTNNTTDSVSGSKIYDAIKGAKTVVSKGTDSYITVSGTKQDNINSDTYTIGFNKDKLVEDIRETTISGAGKDNKLATSKAVVDYINSKITTITTSLKYDGDNSSEKIIDLANGKLTLNGTTDEIKTTAEENGVIKIALDSKFKEKVEGKADKTDLNNLKNASLIFKSNEKSSTDISKKLGETVEILGGENKTYTDNSETFSSKNIRTYTDNDKMYITLSNTPTFDKVTLNNTQTTASDNDLITKKYFDENQHKYEVTKDSTSSTALTINNSTTNNKTTYTVKLDETTLLNNLKTDRISDTTPQPETNKKLATGQAVVDYVNSKVTSLSTTLKYTGNSGGDQLLNLKDGKLSIVGKSKEISTTASADGKIEIALDNEMLTTINNKADKSYVDNNFLTKNEYTTNINKLSEVLNFKDDKDEKGTVNLKTGELKIKGTKDYVETVAIGDTLTINLSQAFKDKVDNKLDKDLTNLTEDGKNAINGLVDVKSSDKTIDVTSNIANGVKTFDLKLDESKIKDLAGTTNLSTEYAKIDASNITLEANQKKWRDALNVYSKLETDAEIAKAKEIVEGKQGEIVITPDTTDTTKGTKYTVSLDKSITDKINNKADKTELETLGNKALTFVTNAKDTNDIAKKLGESISILGFSGTNVEFDNKAFETKNIKTYTKDGNIHIAMSTNPEFSSVKITKDQTTTDPESKELISKEYLETRLDGKVETSNTTDAVSGDKIYNAVTGAKTKVDLKTGENILEMTKSETTDLTANTYTLNLNTSKLVEAVRDTSITDAANDNKLATSKAVKDYVQNVVGSSTNLTFAGDTGEKTISLKETLNINGTKDEIDTKVDNGKLVISLAEKIKETINNKAENSLINITDAGKKVITDLVTIAGDKDNSSALTVSEDVDTNTKVKTLKVKLDENKLLENLKTDSIGDTLTGKLTTDTAVKNYVSNLQLSFKTEDNNIVNKKFNETLEILGDNKNITTKISDGKVIVSLSDTPTFNSVTINNAPTQATDATNKKYVDDRLDTKVDKKDIEAGTIGNVIYTTKSGEKIAKKDGKYYKLLADGSIDESKEVSSDDILLSLVNTDGSTTNKISLSNLQSALGVDKYDETKLSEYMNTLYNTKDLNLTRAVNVQDLQVVANSGLNFVGNNYSSDISKEEHKNIVHKKLSDTLSIKGEGVEVDTKFESASGNITVESKDNDLVVKLSKNLTNVDSIANENNNTKISLKDGITITEGDSKESVNITNNSINIKNENGDNLVSILGDANGTASVVFKDNKGKITGLADIADDADGSTAVNKNYVDEKLKNTLDKIDSIDANRPFEYYNGDEKVSLGKDGKLYKKSDLDKAVYKDGKYTLDGKDLASLNATDVVIKAMPETSMKVTNVANGDVSKNSTDAVNGSQLFEVKDKLDKGLTFNGDTGTVTKQMGDTLKIAGDGKNITTKYENDSLIVSMTDKPKFTTVDVNGVTLEATTSDTENTLAFKGKDDKEVRLTNVAAGKNDTDAVNYKQLKDMNAVVVKYDDESKTKVTLGGVDSKVPVTITNVADGQNPLDAVNKGQLDRVVSSTNSGTASAMAMGAIPQVFDQSKPYTIGAGTAYYKGEGALAFGVSGINKAGNLIFKASTSVNTRADLGVSAGLSYAFGESYLPTTDKDSNNKDLLNYIGEMEKDLNDLREYKEDTQKKLADLENKLSKLLEDKAKDKEVPKVEKERPEIIKCLSEANRCIVGDFETAKTNIINKEEIRELVSALNEYVESAVIDVIGHTDDRGKFDYNLDLGLQRAKEVVNLLKEYGLKKEIVFRNVTSSGKIVPIDGNKTTLQKAENRRVEIHFDHVKYK